MNEVEAGATQVNNYYGKLGAAEEERHVEDVSPEASAALPQAVPPQAEPLPEQGDEELFHFIHPTLDAAQEREVHDVVKRLVRQQGLQEICTYLLQMREEQKILLPQNSERAYTELVRMGMPDGEGFSLKTFMKYYKR